MSSVQGQACGMWLVQVQACSNQIQYCMPLMSASQNYTVFNFATLLAQYLNIVHVSLEKVRGVEERLRHLLLTGTPEIQDQGRVKQN